MNRKAAAAAPHKDPLVKRYGTIGPRAIAAAARYQGKGKNRRRDLQAQGKPAERGRTEAVAARKR
jgi:hypothetical protein